MKKRDALRAVNQIIESGYRHSAYETEKEMLRILLLEHGDTQSLLMQSLEPCKILLGPTPLRAVKNGLICLITTISRASIEYGADSDYSFALSDFYINEVEGRESMDQLMTLYTEIVDSYRELIKEKSFLKGSADIRNALKYIHQHIYEPIRVKEIARQIHMSESNLSKKFRKEVGTSISVYIEDMKLKEAKKMLLQRERSVVEISECLGFCNSSYFAKRFKDAFGILPSKV